MLTLLTKIQDTYDLPRWVLRYRIDKFDTSFKMLIMYLRIRDVLVHSSAQG